MSQFAVITENDESPWEDVKGEVYRTLTHIKKFSLLVTFKALSEGEQQFLTVLGLLLSTYLLLA